MSNQQKQPERPHAFEPPLILAGQRPQLVLGDQFEQPGPNVRAILREGASLNPDETATVLPRCRED